jgi:hypothetical protein
MDQFEFHYREEEEGFVFPVTVHPDVCGHPHGLLMLERYVLSFAQASIPATTHLFAPVAA